jgi:hypothetical protein
MTGAELAKRFLDYSLAGNLPQAEATDVMATLYGLDEVHIDYADGTVTLPEHGPVECATLEPVPGAAWYATTPVEGLGLQFVIGIGDPYTVVPTNPLPHKGVHVMALPYRVLAASAKSMSSPSSGMNRAQRRAAARGC